MAVTERASSRAYDIGMLVLRLGFGLGFLYFHGWGKISGGPEAWTRTGSAVEHLGIGFWHTGFGFMAAFSEAIGGTLIAIGFLFRPAAVLIALTMFVAWAQHVITGNGNPGHSFKNMWVAIGLGLMGPGRYSVDAWIARRREPVLELPAERSSA